MPSLPVKPQLPNYLFWDIDLKAFDFDYSYKLVIERIIQMGTMPQWRAVQWYFGKEKFLEVAEKSRTLSERDKSFTRLFVESDYNALPGTRSDFTEHFESFTPA